MNEAIVFLESDCVGIWGSLVLDSRELHVKTSGMVVCGSKALGE
jgi:hypothetical protein